MERKALPGQNLPYTILISQSFGDGAEFDGGVRAPSVSLLVTSTILSARVCQFHFQN